MENYTTVKGEELIRISAQEAIKTPLALELEKDDKIVDVSLSVFTQSVEVGDKQARINARILFNVIYKNGSELTCYESGTDLPFDLKHDALTVKNTVFPEYKVSRIDIEQNEESVAISALIDCEACFFSTLNTQILSGAVDAVCKTETKTRSEKICGLEQGFEVEGEKILPYSVKKVLSHKHAVMVKETQVGINEVISDGEIISEFLLLTNSNGLQFESLTTPFRLETECDGVSPDDVAISHAIMQSANLQVVSEEENAKSTINVALGVKIYSNAYKLIQTECLQDAFYPANEIILERGNITLQGEFSQEEITHKFFGEAIIERDAGESIKSLLSCEITDLDYKVTADKLQISAVASAKVIAESQEDLKSATAELPLNFTLNTIATPVLVYAYKKSISVKQSDGKCFIEGEVALVVITCETQEVNALTAIEKGAEKQVDGSTIGVIFIQSGEDEWSVCKKAGVDQKTLAIQNPDLVFPAEKDCAVVVYRREN